MMTSLHLHRQKPLVRSIWLAALGPAREMRKRMKTDKWLQFTRLCLSARRQSCKIKRMQHLRQPPLLLHPNLARQQRTHCGNKLVVAASAPRRRPYFRKLGGSWPLPYGHGGCNSWPSEDSGKQCKVLTVEQLRFAKKAPDSWIYSGLRKRGSKIYFQRPQEAHWPDAAQKIFDAAAQRQKWRNEARARSRSKSVRQSAGSYPGLHLPERTELSWETNNVFHISEWPISFVDDNGSYCLLIDSYHFEPNMAAWLQVHNDLRAWTCHARQ